MQDLFLDLPDMYIKVSRGFVENLIQTQRDELFTGVMRLHYRTGEVLLLTFLEGNQQNLYRCHENNTEAIPRQSWSETLDRPDASVALLRLSEDAIRFIRCMCGSPILQAEKETYSTQELSECVGKWAADGSPSILHLQVGGAHKVYLIAGYSTPIIEELSLTGEEAQLSICDASFPVNLPSHEYQVTRCTSDSGHEVWQEYELRFAFNPMMRMMLIRFSELAGRLLTDRLCDQLSQSVGDGRKHIGITVNGIANHQYFNSIEDAAKLYYEIVRRFREDAGAAIGLRLVDGIVRDTLFKLDPRRREILKHHIYERYGLDTLMGLVWR